MKFSSKTREEITEFTTRVLAEKAERMNHGFFLLVDLNSITLKPGRAVVGGPTNWRII